jgi:hypothetical protein
MVEDYGEHLPMCPAVRMAFDDSYPMELRANHHRASESAQAAGQHERARRKQPARPLLKFKRSNV